MNDYLIKQYGSTWYNNFSCIEKEVVSAKSKINKNKKTETNGRIISELSFGTWTKILKHFKEENNFDFLIKIFNISDNLSIKQKIHAGNISYKMCEQIRILRNRCVHHENIIKNIIKLKDNYTALLEITSVIYNKEYRTVILKEVNKSYGFFDSSKRKIFNNILEEIEKIHR
ncbi:MAG: hypothetical protein LBH40_01595 [Alphaproteobacteria bacterium]|jgi:hypothetical protein|nr:hypothetical protein [Alphaproteobacteria bacterium]